MRVDARTKAYVARRIAQGRTKREIMWCLKRYVARERFFLLRPQPDQQTLPTAA